MVALWLFSVLFVMLIPSGMPSGEGNARDAVSPDPPPTTEESEESVKATSFLCSMYSTSNIVEPGVDYSECFRKKFQEVPDDLVPRKAREGRADDDHNNMTGFFDEASVDYSPSHVWKRLMRSSYSITRYSFDALAFFAFIAGGWTLSIIWIVFAALLEIRGQPIVYVVFNIIIRMAIALFTGGATTSLGTIMLLVLIPLIIIGASSAVAGMHLVVLVLFGVFFGAAMAFMSSRNKIPVDATALIALMAIRFFGALRPIINNSMTLTQGFSNVALMFSRILLLGSGETSLFASVASALDARYFITVVPECFWSETRSLEDVDAVYYGITALSFILRGVVIFLFRYAMTRMRYIKQFRDPETRESAATLQYLSAIFTYVPVITSGGDHHIVLVLCNLLVTLSMVSSNIDLFAIAIGTYVVTLGTIGEPVYEQLTAAASKKAKADKKPVQKHRHVYIENEDGDLDAVPVFELDSPADSESVLRQARELHAALPVKQQAQVSVDVGTVAIRTVNRSTTPLKTKVGRATGVFIDNRTLLSVRHAFCDTSLPDSHNLDDYVVSFGGDTHVPSKIRRGPVDIQGEAVMQLTFPKDVTQADMFAVPARHAPALAHVMVRRGAVSVDTKTTLLHQHPPFVQYAHECLGADSGCGGYQIDGSAHVLLTTLHVGTMGGHSIGITIPEPDKFVDIPITPAPDYGTPEVQLTKKAKETRNCALVPTPNSHVVGKEDGLPHLKKKKKKKEQPSDNEAAFSRLCAATADQINLLGRKTRVGKTVTFSTT